MTFQQANAIQTHLASVGFGCAIGETGHGSTVAIGFDVYSDYTEAKKKAVLIVAEAKSKGLSKV